MKELLPNYELYFDDSEYRPLMFKPDFKWHFAKSKPYKHYFVVFDEQIKLLPSNQLERLDFIKTNIELAIGLFKEIQNGIYLDENNDGSHLPTFMPQLKSPFSTKQSQKILNAIPTGKKSTRGIELICA